MPKSSPEKGSHVSPPGAVPRRKTPLKPGALQDAISNSAYFSSIATDENGVIQIFNVGAERMLGYTASDVVNKITPADISDPRELIARAAALSAELDADIAPGFEALVFKASRGIEDIYELTYVRKDGSRFPAVVSVTALRDAQDAIIGYLLIGTDNTARKQAEEALLKAGALQNAIFNSANFSSIATDANGVIQIFNVGAERMLGYTAAEVMNKITPADISDPQELIARAQELSLELGTSITPGFEALVFKASRGIEDIYELTYIRKDGSRFPAIVSVTALRDDQDAIIGYLLIGTDNTARKQADDKVRAASQYARRLLEASLDPLVTISPEGKITDVNAGSVKVTGVPRENLIGTDFSNYFTEPEKAREGYQQVFAEGFVTDYPLTIRHEDGRLTDVLYNASVYKDEQGNVLGVFAAARDITARMRAEEALLKAGALQNAIFNSANFSSIATDAKGVIQIFNVGAERMLGYTAAEVMNKITPADISDPKEVIARAAALSIELGAEIAPGFEALVFKASRGIEDIYELTYVRKDGSRFPANVSVTSLRDSGGDIIGYLLIGTDNTVRKQIEAARDSERDRFEQTLQEKNLELVHASRMKTEFLATMSHELRTPLNAIIGFSEALKDGMVGEMNGNQGEYIGDIFNSGQHLLSLINDILDLSKIEAGMMALELEPVDLNALLANSLSIVREKAARQRIQLELDIEGGLDSLELDMRKTKQVIYNLLSNAVKFSSHGGRVLVRAKRVPRSDVGHISGEWQSHSFPLANNSFQEFVEISVSDQGIGIAGPSLPKLFHAFTQIDSGLARRFEGTGLGLAMVRQLVELHGGAVAVSSAEGEGTCVVAWLPLIEARESDTHGAASSSGVAPMERFALVVEDDERAADLLRLMLEAEGFTVIHTLGADSAASLVQTHSLSLITLAWHLPGMDGLELLEQMRMSPELAQVPVVVIANARHARVALDGGAAVLLQQPISRAQLKGSLAMLGLHAAQEHTYTVLIVDDDPKALEVIAAFLPSPTYTLIRALGGKDAIHLARQYRPELILLDLMMPEVDGFDVIEALQRDIDTARIPVLVVTAMKISAGEHRILNSYPDKIIHIIEKAGFNRIGFISEVRRALTEA